MHARSYTNRRAAENKATAHTYDTHLKNHFQYTVEQFILILLFCYYWGSSINQLLFGMVQRLHLNTF